MLTSFEATIGPENGTRGGSMQVQPEIHEMVPLPHKTFIFWMLGVQKIVENSDKTEHQSVFVKDLFGDRFWVALGLDFGGQHGV